MTAVNTAPTAAVLIEKGEKGKGFKAQASEESWAKALETGERVYTFTLKWIAANPVLSALFLVFAGWWIHQSRRTKVEIAGLKSDYQSVRERARLGSPQSRRRRD